MCIDIVREDRQYKRDNMYFWLRIKNEAIIAILHPTDKYEIYISHIFFI